MRAEEIGEVKEEAEGRPGGDWEIPFEDDEETMIERCRASMRWLNEVDPWYDD